MAQTTTQSTLLQLNNTALSSNLAAGRNGAGKRGGPEFSSMLQQQMDPPASRASAARPRENTDNTSESRAASPARSNKAESREPARDEAGAPPTSPEPASGGAEPTTEAATSPAPAENEASPPAGEDGKGAESIAGLPAALAALMAQLDPAQGVDLSQAAGDDGALAVGGALPEEILAGLREALAEGGTGRTEGDGQADLGAGLAATDEDALGRELLASLGKEGSGEADSTLLKAAQDAIGGASLRSGSEALPGSFGAALHAAEAARSAAEGVPGSTGIAGLANGVAQRADSAATPRLQIQTPQGHAGWSEEIGSKVSLMLGRNDSKAELVLTPSHLGKLEISLHMEGDQTTATFVASTQAARDALEQSLPRLREILQQAGINLTHSDVSTYQQQAGQQGSGEGRGGGNGSGRGYGLAGGESDANRATSTPHRSMGRGLVDTFA